MKELKFIFFTSLTVVLIYSIISVYLIFRDPHIVIAFAFISLGPLLLVLLFAAFIGWKLSYRVLNGAIFGLVSGVLTQLFSFYIQSTSTFQNWIRSIKETIPDEQTPLEITADPSFSSAVFGILILVVLGTAGANLGNWLSKKYGRCRNTVC